MNTITKPLQLVAVVSVLSACTVGPAPKPDDPNYAPVLAPPAAAKQAAPGSIYQASYGGSLYTDRRATQIGDIVTITLTERTSSTKSASTAVTKDNELGFELPNLLGTQQVGFANLDMSLAVNQERDFSGAADAAQSNSLQGSIAVTVADILPNGLLVVKGERWITLNRGDEFIRIRGLIRPEDISPNNTVASTKVADARITYSGAGELAESNDMGWGARFFNSRFWPF